MSPVRLRQGQARQSYTSKQINVLRAEERLPEGAEGPGREKRGAQLILARIAQGSRIQD